MQKAFLFLIISSVLFTFTDASGKGKKKTAEEYDVYLLIGQSNMAGRGKMEEGDDASMRSVWLLNADDVPEPAANPLNRYSTVRKDIKMQQIGPGTAFGYRVARKTGRKILLVVNALGGSSIEYWAKDGPLVADKGSIAKDELRLYDEAVRRAREAMKYGQLKGILWHQGEANSRAVSTYMEKLGDLVSNLRKDLDAPQVPFIVGELAWWRSSSPEFNEMLRTISDHIPHSGWVSAEGAGMLKDKTDPHFSREGQLLLGERYADKVLEMVYGRVPK